jgi:hypothetical protein
MGTQAAVRPVFIASAPLRRALKRHTLHELSMYVVPLVTHVIPRLGKIVIAEGPPLGKFAIADTS